MKISEITASAAKKTIRSTYENFTLFIEFKKYPKNETRPKGHQVYKVELKDLETGLSLSGNYGTIDMVRLCLDELKTELETMIQEEKQGFCELETMTAAMEETDQEETDQEENDQATDQATDQARQPDSCIVCATMTDLYQVKHEKPADFPIGDGSFMVCKNHLSDFPETAGYHLVDYDLDVLLDEADQAGPALETIELDQETLDVLQQGDIYRAMIEPQKGLYFTIGPVSHLIKVTVSSELTGEDKFLVETMEGRTGSSEYRLENFDLLKHELACIMERTRARIADLETFQEMEQAQNQEKTVKGPGFTAKIGFTDHGCNQAKRWSITGTVKDSSGAVGETIAALEPSLAIFEKLHLCAFLDGLPMYAIANSVFLSWERFSGYLVTVPMDIYSGLTGDMEQAVIDQGINQWFKHKETAADKTLDKLEDYFNHEFRQARRRMVADQARELAEMAFNFYGEEQDRLTANGEHQDHGRTIKSAVEKIKSFYMDRITRETEMAMAEIADSLQARTIEAYRAFKGLPSSFLPPVSETDPDTLTVKIEGETLEIMNWNPENSGFENNGFSLDLSDGSTWLLYQDQETAGTDAREYWSDMAENDKDEFAALVGVETLVSWALGEYAGPGTTQVNSLNAWLDEVEAVPVELFGRYDGQEHEGALNYTATEEMGLDSGNVVLYRQN